MNRETNSHLFDMLRNHFGHKIVIAAYGDSDNPRSLCVECKDCRWVILEAFCDEDFVENFGENGEA